MLRALGLAALIIVLQLLVPQIFSELSKTIIIFLQSSDQAFAAAGVIASHASSLIPPSP